jgi:hypothetical protein
MSGGTPGDLHDVGAVQARGANADEQLPVLRLWIWMLDDLDPAVADGGGSHIARSYPPIECGGPPHDPV